MDTFIEEMSVLPSSQEIHAVVRYGEWGAEKITLWFEYRSGQLNVVDTALQDGMPDLNLIRMLVLQRLVETFYRQKKEDREASKKIEESFTTTIDFQPQSDTIVP